MDLRKDDTSFRQGIARPLSGEEQEQRWRGVGRENGMRQDGRYRLSSPSRAASDRGLNPRCTSAHADPKEQKQTPRVKQKGIDEIRHTGQDSASPSQSNTLIHLPHERRG